MSTSPAQIRRMFGRIAQRYDLLNTLLSLGQHRRWKRLTAQACQVPPGGLTLDLCCGTADIALSLPFPDDTFHAAAIGFSFRNVASIPRLLRAIYRAYLASAVAPAPLLSEGRAYRYLLRTILAFPPAERIVDLFRTAGLTDVSYHHLLSGAAAIHTGRVPRLR